MLYVGKKGPPSFPNQSTSSEAPTGLITTCVFNNNVHLGFTGRVTFVM